MVKAALLGLSLVLVVFPSDGRTASPEGTSCYPEVDASPQERTPGKDSGGFLTDLTSPFSNTRPTTLLGRPEKPIFDNIPGAINIVPRDSDQKGADVWNQLRSQYGLLCPESLSDGPSEHHRVCHVRMGHECAWVAVLRESPLVGFVYLAGKKRSTHSYTGSANAEAFLPLPRQSLYQKLQEGGKDVDPLTLTEDFLKARYQGRGDFTRTQRHPLKLEATVSRLRAEIIRSSTFWEKLEITAVVTGGNSVFLIGDGYYAAGIGSTPPAAYLDTMKIKHLDELRDYIGAMAADLTEFLAKPSGVR